MRIAPILSIVLVACGSKPKPFTDGGADSDGQLDDGQVPGDGTPQQCGTLTAILRDFKADHPDFEGALGNDRGLVEDDLGADNKPVYAPGGATTTVSGSASFDEWYRDVASVNMHFEVPLPLTENPPGTFSFENNAFFPLDNMGFGNEGNPHNFHFTTEIHGTFQYRGGEIFTFIGDDDVFVFVNKRLGLDLGGVHGAQSQTIDFDDKADELQITVGNVYQLDVFHAERHTTESNFRMETTIDCFIIQ